MERIIETLDEVKAENEKLRVDLKCKAELFESLKKAHHEQTIQIQQSNSKIEKQNWQLNEKAEEISVARQMCEDLQCRLNEKESIVRHLTSTIDKLRVNYDEKQQKSENEMQRLLLALDEANEKNIDQEQKAHVLMAEIEGLKGLLSASQTKCLEAEKKAKAQKEVRARDDVLLKLEEENGKLQEQLKWKKEQFKHLEEAHVKLRNQLQKSKKEWEREKSSLIDEICSLQTSLDSQTRISEDLQNRLKICNKALAHEENRRKYLEVEIGECKARFENVFTECKDAKSQLEYLNTQRNEELAALRHSLGTKEAIYKEIKYRASKLEQENEELLASLKELQEAQIQEAGNSSVAKLRNKLKSVEQIHRDCSANLQAKEAVWRSQMQKLNDELNNCKFALESKETEAKELKMALENCHAAIMQLELQNEEASVMLLVLKVGMTEAELNLREAYAETSVHDKERDENMSVLKRQLEMKNNALSKALKDNEEEHKKVASLLSRVESLELVEEEQLVTLKELERCKEMLQESSRSHFQFKELFLQTENELKEKIKELCDALEMANSELYAEREKSASLSMKAAFADIIEEKRQLVQKDLERYKELLEESSRSQHCLEEQALNIETNFQETLRQVSEALDSANSELCEEREKVASLLRKVECFNIMEEQLHLMQKELEGYKQKLDESSTCRLQLQKQTLQKDNDFQKKLQEVSDALSSANSELAAKICEGHATEFELWIWESIAQRLKDDLERNQALRKEMEASLLAQVEVGEAIKKEKDSTINDLQYQIEMLEKELKTRESARVERAVFLESEKENLLKTMREKDKFLEDLQKEIGWLEQESLRRELEGAVVEQMGAERIFEREKKNLMHIVEEKDQRIDELLQFASSLEQNFNCSLFSLSSELAEKQVEISFVQEAWEKIAAAEILAQLEIEEKKLMIVELEDEISSIQQKLEAQGKSLSYSKQQALEIDAKLEAKQMEIKNLTSQMESKLRASEALVDELKVERLNLVEDVMKLSTERENLMDCFVELRDRISQFSDEDVQLAETLERMVQQSLDDRRSIPDLEVAAVLSKYVTEIENAYPSSTTKRFQRQAVMEDAYYSPTTKRLQAVMDDRSPFRELN